MPMISTQFPPSISVTNLNGVNGFAITGFLAGSYGGWLVRNVGDVNADGIADIVIGAPQAFSNTGICYVIFGKMGVGTSGSLDVSGLTGDNGFVINGFLPGSHGGYFVSMVDDLNGDGIADLAVGAPWTASGIGAVYVILGKPGLGSSGSISVSSLTGSNGFVITGFPANSYAGLSVSGAGDVNGDEIADLLIGAPGVGGESGCSYVIFGRSGIGSSGSISVASLTGNDGFIITSFPIGKNAGLSVSGVDDINGDGIADLAIGTSNAPNYPAACYIIFGKLGLGSSGEFNASNLTGSNGFIVTGFPADKYSGDDLPVNRVGDVNGDGIADLVIGIYGSFSSSYVLFGKLEIGSSGNINVSSLTGSDGFAITGFSGGDVSVSGAGDINADGVDDIVIGARFAGTSYVIFGKSNLGETGKFNIYNLTGSNGFSIASTSGGGFSVSGMGDVNADGIADLVIGAPYVSNYAGMSYVIFGESTSVVLSKNQLTVNENQTLIVNEHYLNATDFKFFLRDSSIQYTISGIQHGRFFELSNPGLSLTQFFKQQVKNKQIQFAHDGSMWAPSYNVSVGYSGLFANIPSQAASITFQQSFRLTNNNLIINQGQTVILDSSMLSASDFYNSANDQNLIFLVSNVQHAYFALTSAPGVTITRFTQAQIQSESIQFNHDGSANPPNYMITVINGNARTMPQAGSISFDIPPALVKNTLKINQGQTVILSNNDLNAVNPFMSASDLMFTVSNVQNGYFALTRAPTLSVTHFTQAQINMVEVQFVSDGTNKAPSYLVLVSDGRMSSVEGPQPAAVTFNDIPVIITNQLKIIQGETIILGTGDLNAVDQETPAGELVFTASDLAHGHFEDIATPGVATVVFAQQRVMSGGMKFVTDGSASAPAYSVSVSDGVLSSAPSKAIVNFSLKQPDVSAQDNTVRNAIIGGVVSGVVGLGFFAIRACLARKAAKNLQVILEGGKTEVQERLIKFQKEVIRPVADKVFGYIKTTNLIGYRSEMDTRAYIAAIEILLGKLVDLRVNLDLLTIQPAQQSRLFTEIAKQTRLQLVPNYGCCSYAYIASFFKPEITPQQIEENADIIAAAVQTAMRSSSQTTNTKPLQRTLVEPTEMQEISISDTLAG